METNKGSKKSYSKEFKREAVARCKAIGKTKASEELGIALSTLHRWSHENHSNINQVSANKPSYEELEKENRRLKKELGYVEEINRVLKKSTAIFSSKELGGLK